jgi:RNA polymerase sigma-70 factor (ECF subfamily)
MDSTTTFELHRPALLALAYRMLGDLARAEDVVQDAWVRWSGHDGEVEAPKPFLLKVVTRLCLNEMESARARREESRGDRLPEPVDLEDAGLARVEMSDRISMAFLVLLQRLTPAERAALLLHDVFEFSHGEIADLLHKSEPACRQLLARARENVAEERRALQASAGQHRRLLRAFVQASGAGEPQALLDLLASDATLIIDAGPGGSRVGRIRSVGRAIEGARRIAAFIAQVSRADSGLRETRECSLNGEPAIVVLRDGRPHAAIFVSVADGKIQRAFIQTDPARLTHLGSIATVAS